MTSKPPKLLLVDDGDRYAELLHQFLRDYDYVTRCDLPGPCWQCPRRKGCTLTHAHDLAEAEAALSGVSDVDAVLLDVAFDLPADRLAPSTEKDLDRRRRLQGLDILKALRTRRSTLPVVLMTSREELALEEVADLVEGDEFVTLAGADTFDARAIGMLIERVVGVRREVTEKSDYLWGRSTEMARLRRDAVALARTSLPILLLGETGSGKSALAERVIHRATTRKGPFVAVDLSAIPQTLVAAELFGTARGAYSGAVDRPGVLEAAHGGTLLLDEIGNLPLEVQRMLLLAIENGRVTRLGESTPRPIDVKLIAATNADLPALVASSSFRADLYARLNPTARLLLPPLRNRSADIEELIGAFVQRAFSAGVDRTLLAEYGAAAKVPSANGVAAAFGRVPPTAAQITFVFPSSSLAAMRAHAWPGNVRELSLVVSNAALFALSDALAAATRGRAATASAPRIIPVPAQLVRRLIASAAPDGAIGANISMRLQSRSGLRQVARDLERQLY
ncbi:MAG TPA: sigma 54-interacting transcriptional regulator, partial [Gemmatimonadaceae bacterium]|nr:sigma 54-interacting transcriptional regulator [Gemmatimonadaceae bacterium]